MNKLNICVDIDGTITEPYYWIEYANKYFNLNIREKDVTQYEIGHVLGVDFDSLNRFYSIYGKEMLFNAKVRENAKSILWELSKRHNIYYVTARDKRLKDMTLRWFKDNNLPMNELYLLGSHYKVDKAKELNCNIFLEDRYENAVELSSSGFEVLLLDCNYNRCKQLEGMNRVYDWKEANDFISQVEKNIKITA